MLETPPEPATFFALKALLPPGLGRRVMADKLRKMFDAARRNVAQ